MTLDPSPTSLGGTDYLPTVVLVDEDSQIPKLCRDIAEKVGFHVVGAATAGDALEVFQRESVDLIITDITFPLVGSMKFVELIRRMYPHTGILVLTQCGTIESAVEAIRLGVVDFVTRPFDEIQFQHRLESFTEALKLERIRKTFSDQLISLPRSAHLIGQSTRMLEIHNSIAKASQHEYPVLIIGESGTGKELVARSIHNLGNRANSAFIPVDCASLTPTLIESELFGHEKGAFTGAFLQKTGMFQAANNGTLFLDEIGELPKELQAKLLRVLQEKAVRRVGSTQFEPINVRIIAATNRDLSAAVQAKEFREDLFYRLNVVQLNLPPLRERKSDIPLLVAAFIKKHELKSRPIDCVTAISWTSLLAHDWPGNVRELENVIESALALGSGPVLDVGSLDPGNNLWRGAPGWVANHIYSLEALERIAIRAALTETQGDKQAAALKLGIGKTTLYRKLKQYESADAHVSV